MKDLLIDVGSTNVKYKIVQTEDISFVPFPSAVRDDYPYFEVSTAHIMGVIKGIIDNVTPDRVFFSVQMHGYVLLKNGVAVTNYISWRDERGKDIEPDFRLNGEYGVNIKPNLPRLSVKAQTVEFDEFCTLGSFICRELTGVNASHVTDIAPTGFYNVKHGKYDLLPFALPKVLKDVASIGKYGNSSIYAPVGDQQASILGVTEGNDAEYVLNLGTASQLCCVEKGFVSGEYENRPYFNGNTLCTVTRLPGGAVIRNVTDEAISPKLVTEYKRAMDILPKKPTLLATGGVVNHRKQLIDNVLNEIKIPHTFNEECDALKGLEMLSKGVTMKRVGFMLSEIPFAQMPVLIKNSGLDFFILDYEHGGFDYSAMLNLITNAKLCKIEVIVRLPNNQRKDIVKVLDMGADGVLLPMTDTAEDIKQVVEYAKYSPIGKRGISTMRAHTLYAPPALLDYMKEANERVKVFAQIETVSGVEHIDDILSVEGVEGILVGPNDLSCDYGCLGNNNAPEILSTIEKVGESAKAHGKTAGIITGNKKYLAKADECGYTVVSVGSELNAISDYCKKIVAENKN